MTIGTPAGTPESGAEFRRKYEEALAENAALRQAAAGLAQRAFQHVKPGDFEGVDPTKYVETAEAVQSTRETERESIFAEMAAARGIDVSSLTPPAPPAKSGASDRIASLGEMRGTPPAPRDNTEGLTGRALLEAVYATQE